MALYEILPRIHPYSLFATQIDNDPITDLERVTDVESFQMSGFSIILNTMTYYSQDGELITDKERLKTYPHSLYCSIEGPYVNMQGQRVEADENGNYPEGSITRHEFLMMLFDSPVILKQMFLMFIQNAAVTLKEFDK